MVVVAVVGEEEAVVEEEEAMGIKTAVMLGVEVELIRGTDSSRLRLPR